MQMMPFVFMRRVIAQVPRSAKGLVWGCRGWQTAHMSRQLVNQHCATLPGATVSDPWGGGHDCWKVGGKMFAVTGAMADHGVSVKCADMDTAALLIDMGRGMRAPYLHKSWIRLPWGLIPDAELIERLTISYQIIRQALPKKVQAGLGAVF